MIESGSHVPDIDPADFGLPAGTALRYELPADPLRALLPSYAVLDSDPRLWSGPDSWLPPSWAQLWIVLTEAPIAVTIRNRRYDPLGAAVLYGVTSRAMPVSSQGGVTILVDVGPLGWARLFAESAEAVRDRISPLDQLVPEGWADDLVARLHGCDRGPAVKRILDDFFLERLPPPHPQEPLIATIAALLADAATTDLLPAAEQAGIGPRQLARLTKHYFGFPPKMLMMRTRFMRALAAMLLGPDTPDFAAVPAGYHDVSHFIRDGKRFLGMTPRRFFKMDMPYLRAAFRARQLVIGSPTPCLDRPMVTPIQTSPRSS